MTTKMQFKPTKSADDGPVLTYPFKIHQSPEPTADTGGYGRVFQKSVTLHAYMEGYPRSTDDSFTDTGWFLWGITEAQLPIVVGAAAGGLVLILTLFGLVIWRFCQHQKSKEKQYCLQNCEEERQRRHSAANQNFSKRSSNDSVVYVGAAQSCVSSLKQQQQQVQYHLRDHREHAGVEQHGHPHVPTSQQHHHHHQRHHHHHHGHHHHRHHQQQHHAVQGHLGPALDSVTGSSDRSDTENSSKATSISRSRSAPVKDKDNATYSSTKKRPQSQPIDCGDSIDVALAPHLYHVVTTAATQPPHRPFDDGGLLPDIPEIRLQSSETLDSDPQSCCYSSTYTQTPSSCSSLSDTEAGGAYDHAITKRHLQIDASSATLKTRSLPAWVRSRPRPLSTEDDLNELYAKVNFNKKRKNRMRNDSAAAIALNKSRSQFIHFPFMHKDTDSLVDNEAIVVFDERTAL